MADSKITALAALTAADPVNDMFPVVDVSDTSMAASGTTKRISVNNILSSSPTASGALTVTGLVTAGSASITGDLTVDTTTLVVDSTNNRVGIGTATPADTLDVNGRVTALRYLSSSSSASLPSFAVAAGNGIYNSGANQIGFAINSANAMTLNASGNLAFPTGKGIDFSAVTGGTGTATGNVLNDYEEGTFLPTVQGGTTAGVGVYSTQDARYTKVGRLVTAEIYIVWTAHTGTGDLRIGGLPFTANASYYSGVTIGLASNITLSASNTISAINQINSTYINIIQLPVGGGTFSNVPMDVAGTMVLSCTYSV